MVDYDKKYFLKDGKGYVVRFFDCEDSRDLRDLVLTVESPEVQRWMENVNDLNFVNYRKWMDEKGLGDKFLFAVADPRGTQEEESRVHGFVYVYPSDLNDGSLEVSYARRPGAPSGIISPALIAVCEAVTDIFKVKSPIKLHYLKFIAEIERDNIASIKVVERAGFTKITEFDEKNEAWWVKGASVDFEAGVKTETKAEEARSTGLERVRQENGSYCGPAVVKILLSHYGIEVTQEEIVNAGSTREHAIVNGMSLEKLADAVKKTHPEMSLWVKRNASLYDLEKMVRVFNYPVVVNWQGIFELDDEYEEGLSNVASEFDDPMLKGDQGHYCVVIDVDRSNNHIRMMDPYGHYSERDRFIEVQEFMNRWWDDRMDKNPDGSKKYVYENRLMFVIVPKGVRVPESLGMEEV